MRWPFGPPHLTLKPSKKNKKTKKKQKQKNKEGLGPSEVALWGHLTWPLNPPNKNKTKTKQNKQNKKTTKNNKKRKTKKEKVKNTKIPKKELFSYQSKFSFFLTGYPKIAFFDTLAQKTRTQKPYKNRGFRLFFLERSYASRNGHFWTKKTQIHKFQLSFFFLPFFSFSKTKNTKICWNPYFYSVLANLKKENFPKINLKHRKLKNPIFAPIFWKRLFLDNCQIIGHKKKH